MQRSRSILETSSYLAHLRCDLDARSAKEQGRPSQNYTWPCHFPRLYRAPVARAADERYSAEWAQPRDTVRGSRASGTSRLHVAAVRSNARKVPRMRLSMGIKEESEWSRRWCRRLPASPFLIHTTFISLRRYSPTARFQILHACYLYFSARSRGFSSSRYEITSDGASIQYILFSCNHDMKSHGQSLILSHDEPSRLWPHRRSCHLLNPCDGAST